MITWKCLVLVDSEIFFATAEHSSYDGGNQSVPYRMLDKIQKKNIQSTIVCNYSKMRNKINKLINIRSHVKHTEFRQFYYSEALTRSTRRSPSILVPVAMSSAVRPSPSCILKSICG